MSHKILCIFVVKRPQKCVKTYSVLDELEFSCLKVTGGTCCWLSLFRFLCGIFSFSSVIFCETPCGSQSFPCRLSTKSHMSIFAPRGEHLLKTPLTDGGLAQTALKKIKTLSSVLCSASILQRVSLEFYIDVHAHSTMLNGFMYGNVFEDEERVQRQAVFPRLLCQNAPDFSFVSDTDRHRSRSPAWS